MENLHEMGFLQRERRKKIRNRVLLGVALTVLFGALFLAGARIDGLEREVAQAQAEPGAEWYGIKSVTAVLPENGGGWIVRVIPVPENSETRVQKPETRVGKGKGR